MFSQTMVSDMRSRKLNSPDAEPRKSAGNNHDNKQKHDNDKGKAKSHAHGSFIHRLLTVDREITSKCSICTSPESSHGYLRFLFKSLEISGHGVPWIVVPVLLMYYSTTDLQDRQFLLNLLAGIFLDLLVSVILKVIVRRPRPSVNQNDMFLTASVDRKFSFPSGHCTRVGMVLVLFLANMNLSLLQIGLLLLWVLAIATSRLVLGRHYISDVCCGLMIGILQGFFIQNYWLSLEYVENLKNYFKFN